MGINNAPAGWSSTLDTVHGKYCWLIYIVQHNTDHDTTGRCFTFAGAVDWKSCQLKPTAQSATDLRKHERDNGLLGGAQGIHDLPSIFCVLSSVCFLSVHQQNVF